MKALIGLLTGMMFGAGLAISGMSDRNKVLNFLDLAGSWDASLMFVMAAALLVSLPAFHFILKLSKPYFDDYFHLPDNIMIDRQLVVGGVTFGIGWGLYGYCPGPAIASLVYLHLDSVIFVAAMLLGITLSRKIKLS
ncbi:MAG: YeeE/YedE family protein [Agarilytica sp.]